MSAGEHVSAEDRGYNNNKSDYDRHSERCYLLERLWRKCCASASGMFCHSLRCMRRGWLATRVLSSINATRDANFSEARQNPSGPPQRPWIRDYLKKRRGKPEKTTEKILARTGKPSNYFLREKKKLPAAWRTGGRKQEGSDLSCSCGYREGSDSPFVCLAGA
jgi:hypothetical protein